MPPHADLTAASPAPAAPRSVLRALLEHSAPRFLATGLLSIAVDTGLLYLLHGKAGVWLPLATFIAVLLSFALNFSLNRFWSFGSRTPVRGQIARYLTLAAGNWIFNVVLVTSLAALGMHYLVAKVITVAIASVLNYIGYRAWVFT